MGGRALGADVVLINPPRLKGVTRRPSYTSEPHLGLAYVTSVLERDGFSVRFLDGDATGLPVEELARTVERENPLFVGFTAPTALVKSAAAVAGAIKQMNPNRTTVIGGYHATALPEETLAEFAAFDFAVCGEGEVAALEFARSCAEGNGFEKIRGLARRDNGDIKYSGSAPPVRDLDSLPFPAWERFPLAGYRAHYRFDRAVLEIPVSTGRGCAGRCRFCARVTGHKIRRRDADSIVEEIRRNVDDFGAEAIVFMDETFAAIPELVEQVCRKLIDRGLHRRIYWLCQTRVDSVNAPLLRLMAEAGCRHVAFGVESGDTEILSTSGKGIGRERIRQAVRDASDAGILVDNFFVFGLAGETRRSIRQTVKFARELDSAFANFFILVPYPGTELFDAARRGEGGMRLLTCDWDYYGIQMGRAYELEGLPRSVLEREQFLAYLRFYLRPSKIRYMFRIVSLKVLPVYLWNMTTSWLRRVATGKRAA